MKNFIYLLGTGCIVATCLVSVGGCSTDYEEPYSSDLTIENQITRIKRTSPELGGGEIPVLKDECALYALTYLKGKKGGNGYWDRPENNAGDYYKNMKDYATNNYEYGGGEMNESTILEVGKQFNLIKDKISFNNAASAKEFFDKSPNKAKIIGIPGHVGTFNRYNCKTGMVKYNDSKGVQDCPVTQVTTVFY